jgi:protein-disulfide isomerase
VNRKILIASIAGAVLVAVALIVASLVGGNDDGSGTNRAADQGLFAGIDQEGTALGDPGAPRTLGVFADLQCPFCQQWDEEKLPSIVNDYVRPGQVRIVFRGLAFLGPESDLGLRAVLAAGLQDRLWNLVDALYANQGKENSGWLTDDLLRKVGGEIPGLDVDRMLADLHASDVDREIAAAQAAADEGGINGTPSFVLGPTGETLEPVAQRDLDFALAG